MEKIIEIDINNKYHLVNKYNDKKLSNDLLDYIIKQSIFTHKNEKIKIVINKKCELDIDSATFIKEGLKEEYNRSLQERHNNNMKQLGFMILGIIFIFLSTLIKDRTLWKELLVITGWVPIWEMIELEIFPDAYGRKERRVIKKLLSSEIEEKKECD